MLDNYYARHNFSISHVDVFLVAYLRSQGFCNEVRFSCLDMAILSYSEILDYFGATTKLSLTLEFLSLSSLVKPMNIVFLLWGCKKLVELACRLTTPLDDSFIVPLGKKFCVIIPSLSISLSRESTMERTKRSGKAFLLSTKGEKAFHRAERQDSKMCK